MRVTFILAGGALAVLCANGSGLAQAPETVGVSNAVQPDTRGTLPGGAGHVLQVGRDVFRDELVRTDRDGRAQVLFLDGTRFSIFPNDEVVLNQYRFDPRRGGGKLAATLRYGAVRATAGAVGQQPGDLAVSLGNTGIAASLRQDAVALITVSQEGGGSSVINQSGKEGGPASVTINTPNGPLPVPPGMRQDVNGDGTLGMLRRAGPDEVDALMRQLEGGHGTGQRAGEANLQAIGRRNSEFAPGQLLLSRSVRDLDVRDLDVLSGRATGRLGDLAQRQFVGALPPPPPPGRPIEFAAPANNTISVSPGAGTVTLQPDAGPPVTITPGSPIVLVPRAGERVVFTVNRNSEISLGSQILRQGTFVLQGVAVSPQSPGSNLR